MFKNIFFAMIGTTLLLTINAQSVKDYFVPDTTSNKARFSKPKSASTRTIYYFNKGNSYELKDVSQMYSDVLATITSTFIFTTTEVQMTKSVVKSKLGSKTWDHTTPSVVLKMPESGKTLNWVCVDPGGDTVKCKSSWTTVKFNGEQRGSIQVEKTFSYTLVKIVDYYVKGIGFWKSEVVSTNETMVKDQFEALEFDPEAK